VPKHGELIEQTAKLGLRLGTAARRAREGMRAHLRAAARGLPRRSDLLALPRQRFDAVDRRLGRALRENTRRHGDRLMRSAARLQPRLLEQRLARTRDRIETLGHRAQTALDRRIAPRRARLERVAGRLSPQPIRARMARSAERIEALQGRARQSMAASLAAHRRHLGGCGKLLASLSYQGVLERGYALVRDGEGRMLRSVAQIVPGQRLDIEFGDGRVDAQALGKSVSKSVDEADQQARASAPPRKKTETRGGGQGSLF
jgi:exodeoxyribonuclease VII large subunit